MELAESLPDAETLQEYWPLLVGVAIILVGNVYYYGVLERDWQPIGPPLLIALLVVGLLEIGRALARRR